MPTSVPYSQWGSGFGTNQNTQGTDLRYQKIPIYDQMQRDIYSQYLSGNAYDDRTALNNMIENNIRPTYERERLNRTTAARNLSPALYGGASPASNYFGSTRLLAEERANRDVAEAEAKTIADLEYKWEADKKAAQQAMLDKRPDETYVYGSNSYQGALADAFGANTGTGSIGVRPGINMWDLTQPQIYTPQTYTPQSVSGINYSAGSTEFPNIRNADGQFNPSTYLPPPLFEYISGTGTGYEPTTPTLQEVAEAQANDYFNYGRPVSEPLYNPVKGYTNTYSEPTIENFNAYSEYDW